MKNKIILTICLAMLTASLSGCGSQAADATNAANSETPAVVETPVAPAETVADIPVVAEVPTKEDIITNVVIEGSIFGGMKDKSIETAVAYNPDWITVQDNTIYNSDLAKFCSILCTDTYFRAKDLDKNTQNRILYEGENHEEYANTAFLSSLGFTDVQFVETYKAGEYTSDTNDSATILMGYSNVDDKYDVFIVALRGCFSAGEWVSAFDIGNDTQEYIDITGEHPEWTNKDQHKGTSVAAQRAGYFINEFINSHVDSSRQTCVLLTGHSRGGSIANLLGADFENNDSIRSYTYTYNAGGMTCDAKAKDYSTIFNICVANDLFENVTPFAKNDFVRYGKDLQIDILNSDEAKKVLSNLRGTDEVAALPVDNKAKYQELFANRFSSRDSLYEYRNLVTAFDNKADAEEYAKECITLIGSEKGLGLDSYCKIDDNITVNDGKYEVSLTYCDAALLISYGKIFAYGDAAYQGMARLFISDADACAIAEFIMENISDINAGHRIINNYAIADLLK